MIDSGQIRAARALLNLHQMQLAEIAGVSPATIKRIETASEIRGAAESLWKIQIALEKCGIEFISGDHEKGPGVRLHKPRATGVSLNRRGEDPDSKARHKRSR